MPIRHQIKDTDTVEYLANEYFGAPERWREIVDYNNLIYPYLSKNGEDRYRVYAKGFIKVTRSVATQPLTLRKYWTVKTRKSVLSGTAKTYCLVNDVTLGAGQTEALVFVRSLIPGIQGNAPEESITELGEDFVRNSVLIDVVNEKPLTGGLEGVIRTTGEYLFIPNADDSGLLDGYDTKFSYEQARTFYGDDLMLSFDEDLVIGTNEDLLTVSFLKNVEQSVKRRFTTESGDILSDFTFGNTIASIIGDSKLAFEAKKRLVQIEVIQCLLYEDRITEPVVESVTLVPSELSCYVTVSMKVVSLGSELKLENMRLGGVN